MSTHKFMDKVCVAALVLSLIITILFMNGSALGVKAVERTLGYENRLFDSSRVHTIDIVMDDWDSFIETCLSEEYVVASVVIDGEAYRNVGIRAKGNTSLSTVAAMNSDRYSFKIEFDQFDNQGNYHGLDKLCLNNLIQDTTYMKDYLTYQMMNSFGVDAPLCSYVYITVNGEDWGLYLAVEGVEESFLKRNYGSNYGDLYKPDSAGFGGGRGNGRDFNMQDFMNSDTGNDSGMPAVGRNPGFGNMTRPDMQEEFDPSSMFGGGMPEGFDPSAIFGGGMPESFDPSAMFGGGMPDDFNPSAVFGGEMPEDQNSVFGDRTAGINGGIFGGMGNSDVKLQYIDDDPDSYSNIFSSAKTAVSTADQKRLIKALEKLSSGEEIETAVDVDEVIRYFVVHNFVVNGDSYTGSMIHNYYLYEQDGQLSMIPWDYNLAFGTFQFFGSNASSAVNDPIDTPLSVTGSGDRPMIDWILSNDEYLELYHQYFSEFIDNTDFVALINETEALIAPFVEKDPTAFYTYGEFETGVAVLREFCNLRAESVRGQLDGEIPSTTAGQSANDSALVDASLLNLSDMGSMGDGMGGGMRGGFFSGNSEQARSDFSQNDRPPMTDDNRAPSRENRQESTNGESFIPAGNFTRPDMSNGMQMMDHFGGRMGVSSQSNGSTVILFVSSVVILLAGLLVAYKFKR